MDDLFADSEIKQNTPQPPKEPPWKVLIVDDEVAVHKITTMTLSHIDFFGAELEFSHAYTSKEAIEILKEEKDFAVILLDVVMETENAGLELIDKIRMDMQIFEPRIILRTGQSGTIPELEAIKNYDVNDYREKTELTRTKLITSLTTAIRSYKQLLKINKITRNLEESRMNALLLAREADKARKETENINEQLRIIKQAVDSSTDAVMMTTTSGEVFYTNETFTDLFSYTLDQLSILPPAFLFKEASVLDKAINSGKEGKSCQCRTEMINADNTIYPIFMRSAPFTDESDNITGIIWNLTNISEQKKAELEIQQYTRKIEHDLAEKKAMLQKAVHLQKSFIQETIPLFNSFNIHALFMPCEHLGGDFFRILKEEVHNKLIIIIGDCTDHGIKASMDASLLSSLMDQHRSILSENSRTDLFLNRISKEFMKIADEDQYPTMLAMVIDITTGETYYSNANSELPYLIRNNKIIRLDKAEGMHIGYFDDPVYELKKFQFEAEDSLFFFSDAIIDIQKEDKSRLGIKGLKNMMYKCRGNAGESFQSLIENLEKENGSLPLNDDTTLILVEFTQPTQIEHAFHNLHQWLIHLEEIRKSLIELDYTKDEVEKISIALDEMCTNSYYHGNKKDENKTITIKGSISCSSIEFTIEDEGEGFNPKEVADPVQNIENFFASDDESLFTHGRGIWITRNFLDSVKYNEKGNQVTLTVQKKQREVLYR